MLTCIACSKELNGGSLHEEGDEDTVATPRTKHAIKSLTSQSMAKDVAGDKACILDLIEMKIERATMIPRSHKEEYLKQINL